MRSEKYREISGFRLNSNGRSGMISVPGSDFSTMRFALVNVVSVPVDSFPREPHDTGSR